MINLEVIKSANKSYVFMGTSNIIRYSISITNLGDETANSIKVRDILSSGATFIPDSLLINGCKYKNFCFNQSISIVNIAPNENVMINFDVEIQRNNPPNAISNKVIVSYFDNLGNPYNIESNELVIPVINIDVCIIKSVDKPISNIGDILSYLIVIRNNSTVGINNVMFFDKLPLNLILLPGSVLVNSVPQFMETLNDGLYIDTIKAKSSVVINFDVEMSDLNTSTVITNIANITYSYSILDNNISISSIGESTSNCAITKVLNYKPFC